MFYWRDARFKRQFATYLADGVGSEDIEEIYTKSTDWKSESVKNKAKKLTHAQCQANIAAKIEKFKAGGGVEEADEEDD